MQESAWRDLSRIATEHEAARLLGLSVTTLRRLRASGSGPPVCRLSVKRLGYRIGDLDRWVSERTNVRT